MTTQNDQESSFKNSRIQRLRAIFTHWTRTNRGRVSIQEDLRAEVRSRSPHTLRERFFMLLDYEPTCIETGEAETPTIVGAIKQWFFRVIWTRRVELFGFILIVAIGVVCYLAVSNATSESNSSYAKPDSQIRSPN